MTKPRINSSAMVDFHTHILPRMDDGVKTVEESVKALSELKLCGVNHLVLSSHFYSNECSVEEFTKARDLSYSLLKAHTEGKELPKLYLGAEVYVTSLLFNNESLMPLTVNGNGIMLTELPYDKKLSARDEENLERLIYNCDITPVLAHIERYPFLLDHGLLDELFTMGCRAQVNIGAFDGRHSRKLKKLVKKGFLFTLGTDTHSLNDAYAFAKQLKAAVDAVGDEYINDAFAYTKEKLLKC